MYHSFLSEILKRSRGVYTAKQTNRSAKMAGAFGQHLDRVFIAEMAGKERVLHQSRKEGQLYMDDVRSFVDQYRGDGLFTYTEGRQHDSFPDLTGVTTVKSPEKLRARLEDHSRRMDFQRGILPRC